jgi:hypothetical protein
MKDPYTTASDILEETRQLRCLVERQVELLEAILEMQAKIQAEIARAGLG